MAESKPVEQKDVIQPGLFNEPIKNALAYQKQLDKTETSLIAIRDTAADVLKKTAAPKDSTGLKEFNKQVTAAQTSIKGLNTVEKEKVKLDKQLKDSTDQQVKAKLRFQAANKAQRDELKALIVLEDQNAGTEEKLIAKNALLRAERKKLNTDTAQGKKRLDEINKSLDKNNGKITKNSDALKKQRRNVGAYSKGVSEGINASGLFSSQLAILQRIQATLSAVTQKNTAATAANSATQKGAAVASGGFSKALKVLKFALIATGIGAIVVLLGSLVAAFGSTQRGADAFSKVLRPIQAIFEKLLGFLQQTGFKAFDRLKKAFEDPKQAVIDLANAIKDNLIARFEAIALFGPAIVKLFKGEFKEGFVALADASVQLTTGIENASEKIKAISEDVGEFIDVALEQGEQVDRLTKRFERLQIDTTVPLAKARLEFQELRAIANDLSKTDKERIDSLNKAEEVQRFIAGTEKKLLALTIERIELEQSFNDTSRKDELELAVLKAEAIQKDEAAQKKINSLIALRSGIENRALAARQKELDELKKINEELQKGKIIKEEEEEIDKEAAERLKKLGDKRIKENEAAEKKIVDAKEEAAKLEAKREEQAKETINNITEATIEAINKRAEAAKKANEEEITRREGNLANLEQLSKEGQQVTEGQRAFEARKLAEAQTEKKRLAEEEKNRQLGISVAKAFNKAIESEEPFKALVTALAATGTETAAVNLLFNKGAYEGTDNVDDSLAVFKLPRAKDPIVTTLHPGEQVWSTKDRAEVGGKSRKEIKAILSDYDSQSRLMASLLFNPQLGTPGGTVNASIVDNSKVIEGLSSVKKSIDRLERDNGRSTGALNELIDSRIREGVSKSITYSARRLTKPKR